MLDPDQCRRVAAAPSWLQPSDCEHAGGGSAGREPQQNFAKDRIMMKTVKHSALAAAFLLAAVAGAAPASAAGYVVKVSMTETTADIDLTMKLGMAMAGDMAKATMSMKAEPATVPAGEVTFEVKNDSKAVVHEMIVRAIADATKPLAFDAKDNRVVEDKASDLGEVAELDPGKSGKLVLTMKPGTYLLYCNVAGHYMTGMWATFTVK
jgi:uncharacterized cupredoxin-like copper-binding protein